MPNIYQTTRLGGFFLPEIKPHTLIGGVIPPRQIILSHPSRCFIWLKSNSHQISKTSAVIFLEELDLQNTDIYQLIYAR